MQAKGTAKEWGVKSIKKRREDEHGNIEFLVEWDGDWAETWEPQVILKMRNIKLIHSYTPGVAKKTPSLKKPF